MASVKSYRELRVYEAAMAASMTLFHLSKSFPKDQRYALTDQMRRASGSVCANLAEAWRKRCYRKHYISKMSDAEAEETRVQLEYALRFGYIDEATHADLDRAYDSILAQLVHMIQHADPWVIRQP